MTDKRDFIEAANVRVQLPYGQGRLTIELPDNHQVTVLERQSAPPLADARGSLRDALRHPIGCPPLRELVHPTDSVGIVFNDITRPTPSREIIHALIDELPHVPAENITLFNALGSHRPNTDQELRGMLDDGLVQRHRIVQNDAFDNATFAQVGTTKRGHPVWLNRELLACTVKILTGFIEPHFFAGFSGGGKAIMPGMAGIATIHANHNARMIGDPCSTWAVTRGNPIWEEVLEIGQMVPGVFLVNVTMNRDKEITRIFCGDLEQAHALGIECVKQAAIIPIPELFDLVITTNSGYPLDMNLYQSVKGMSAAAQAVKPGGAIIIAAECCDGIPEHGSYGRLLQEHQDPRALLSAVCAAHPVEQDQWQVQIQAQLQLKADIHVYSGGLSPDEIRSAMLIPCSSVEATVAALLARYGPRAKICVLPEGPQVIPVLLGNNAH